MKIAGPVRSLPTSPPAQAAGQVISCAKRKYTHGGVPV